MRCPCPIVAAILLLPLSLTQAAAQTLTRITPLDPAPRVAFVTPGDTSPSALRLPADSLGGKKNPVLAGVLAWVFPGLGSYYAGNASHGTAHLIVGVGAIALMASGVAESSTNCNSYTCEPDISPTYWAGLLVGGVNGVWGIIDAVQDANHRNARIKARSQTTTSLILRPDLRLLPATRADHKTRIGLELGSIVF